MLKLSRSKLKLFFDYQVAVIILSIVAGYLFIAAKGAVMAKTNQIELPKPADKGKISLEEAISKRRSQRAFSQEDLNWEQISQLLWAAQGITKRAGGFSFRAVPSAGALYPIEIYLVAKSGLYHYLPEEHKLEVLKEEDLRNNLADAALGQDFVSKAPLDIVICVVYARITAKYGQRGIRYSHIEAGHVAQNIHLQAVALALGSVPIGAFSDEEVQAVLSLPKDHQPLYIIPIGYPR